MTFNYSRQAIALHLTYQRLMHCSKCSTYGAQRLHKVIEEVPASEASHMYSRIIKSIIGTMGQAFHVRPATASRAISASTIHAILEEDGRYSFARAITGQQVMLRDEAQEHWKHMHGGIQPVVGMTDIPPLHFCKTNILQPACSCMTLAGTLFASSRPSCWYQPTVMPEHCIKRACPVLIIVPCRSSPLLSSSSPQHSRCPPSQNPRVRRHARSGLSSDRHCRAAARRNRRYQK